MTEHSNSARASCGARGRFFRDREAGFTLIELLVVVIIIGILAAIAIPVYIGVQNNAKDSAVKSDLVNAKTSIVGAATDNNGNVPSAVTPGTSSSTGGSATIAGAAAAVDLSRYGWSRSSNTTGLTFTTQAGVGTSTVWCVLGTSSTGNKFAISSNTQVTGGTAAAACPAVY